MVCVALSVLALDVLFLVCVWKCEEVQERRAGYVPV